ncbi:hypothetical protein Pfo_019337 [Paulownia fortunei]|nr:hypothetical protein Pfo_019337 [Paulownia fortunei]
MARILQLSITLTLLSLCYIPSFRSAPATSEDDLTQYIELTNIYRAEVNVPPLRWNKSLAEVASNISDHLRSDKQSDAPPPPISDYGYFGMNSYVQCIDTTNQPQTAVWSWWLEKVYTQLVWKNSTEFGCSAGLDCFNCGCPYNGPSGSYGLLFVCVYHPPGNIRGQRPY